MTWRNRTEQHACLCVQVAASSPVQTCHGWVRHVVPSLLRHLLMGQGACNEIFFDFFFSVQFSVTTLTLFIENSNDVSCPSAPQRPLAFALHAHAPAQCQCGAMQPITEISILPSLLPKALVTGE